MTMFISGSALDVPTMHANFARRSFPMPTGRTPRLDVMITASPAS